MWTITPSSFSSRSSAMGTLGFYVGFKRDLGSDTPSLCSSRSSIDGDLNPAHDLSRLVRDGDSRIRFFGDAVLLISCGGRAPGPTL